MKIVDVYYVLVCMDYSDGMGRGAVIPLNGIHLFIHNVQTGDHTNNIVCIWGR